MLEIIVSLNKDSFNFTRNTQKYSLLHVIFWGYDHKTKFDACSIERGSKKCFGTQGQEQFGSLLSNVSRRNEALMWFVGQSAASVVLDNLWRRKARDKLCMQTLCEEQIPRKKRDLTAGWRNKT